ncbi:ketoacyl-ACP synthase III [Alkaliphilus sp. MSJ-5]|uniref:Beta-ketoacyl-[acyl-carrier-protein] synthase III n=1 Tax=Alkaliphilus flagellatus TaxID=2841507 RepID=A0ABS6G4T3_9FIRM|nr:beta-ketoacyl-ACP synthase III [Alkaliphilus flagellatus]MBU5677384.1 ketoacyl-ACP synthase III [Alkaliphilus flagellatus]
MNKFLSVGITGTGSYLPEKELTNFDLENIVDTTDEWIKTRTGISKRRVAEDKIATSDLATEAAKRAIDNAGLSAEDIDLIIVATVTPDMAFPSTACIVQKNIGAKNAAAFDIEAACSGFIYGITIGEQFIKSGVYKNVLVIGAETLSKILNWKDRNTCVLFGDGAGAAILQPVKEGYGILSSSLGADGSSGDYLTQPAGGSRIPASIETVANNLHYVQMDGSEVFKFAVRIMAKSTLQAIESSGLKLNDIDYMIPHQANIRIIEAAAKRLNLDMDKVYVNLNNYGNMSAASVPVALDEAVRKGNIKTGDIVTLVAFGGGLTWGSSVIRWYK